jgi:hypothetical protein
VSARALPHWRPDLSGVLQCLGIVSDDHTPAPTQRTARTTATSDNPISPHCVPNATPTETNSPRDLRAINRRHLMTSEPPPVIHDGDCVTIQGEALVLCYRACLALVMRQHRDGVASPPLLHDLRAVLYRAVMSAPGHEIDTGAAALSCCGCRDGADPISVADAAALLRLSLRQVRRLAAENAVLGGRRIGHAWTLERGAVLALARQREAAK